MFNRAFFNAERLVGAATLIPTALACGWAYSDAALVEKESSLDRIPGKVPVYSAQGYIAPVAVAVPGGAPAHLIHAEVMVRHGQRTPVHVFAGIPNTGFAGGANVVGTASPASVIDVQVSFSLCWPLWSCSSSSPS